VSYVDGLEGVDLNGVPVPKLKQGTNDAIMQLLHVLASNIFLQVFLPWLGIPVQPDPDRVRLANQVSPGDIIEGGIFADVEECAWHKDTQNPPPPNDDLS
jgi:hypothetical protein